MQSLIGVRVPKEVVSDIHYVANEEQLDKSAVVRRLLSKAVSAELIDIALKKYANREISIGRAAELSRLPYADFMKIAAEKKIPINYSVQSLRDDISHDGD
ncbi:MAG TPA: UPF0175 family protein [Candidatus Nanoarchaeia archaeon]|nr:UPF0175 family protein [Candidatus Nanoarchaeia archaeon]